MAFERKYEIPFQHLNEGVKGGIDLVREKRGFRDKVAVASVAGATAATGIALLDLGAAAGGAAGALVITVPTSVPTNMEYKDVLRSLGTSLAKWRKGTAKQPLIQGKFASQHVSEEELRKHFTHAFVRQNGNLVLANPLSAKLMEKEYGGKFRRLRVPI